MAAVCLMAAAGAKAACAGANLFDALSPEIRAELRHRAAQVPHAEGLLWRAERGIERITLVGTFHFDDPRHEASMAALQPVLASARTLLVEAGPEEELLLKQALSERLDLFFVPSGPTLPDRMSAPDWQRLADAMRARGVPGFLAAKFKPWYAAMTLSLSPCALGEVAAGREGLDGRLIAEARARGLPVLAMEPYDAALTLFDLIPDGDQIDLIRAALITAEASDDYTATLADAYFAEETRLIWEFTRHDALTGSGMAAAVVEAQMRLAEDLLIARRNRAWLAPILAAAGRGPVLVASGALHLPGEAGLLALLEAEGFALTRLPITR
ncbi:MAG: TraB/GumN family protein [Phaeovulum sp.]|uniref:TraB/GumN family protein n=2 Tax=Phaeovulum sp. TaxID=2934796 RepID=UPI002731B354|nr:TraB/GumN family protein [Phaeovulum sp.]MDP2062598.1 TraB/GumN family protein [Phaeovulum sp.]